MGTGKGGARPPLSALLIGMVALAAMIPGAGATERVAVKAGRIIPIGAPELENGIILIEDGRIVEIGTGLEIPFDAEVIDASEQVVFPGMIEAYTADGLDRPNENAPVAPFLQVADSLDPSAFEFEEALRSGVTTLGISHLENCVIGAMGRAVRPIGLTAGEMTVLAETGLIISLSPKRGSNRMAQMAQLRAAFQDLEEAMRDLAEKKYEEKLEEEERKIDVGPDEAAEKGKELITLEDIDDKYRNLHRLTTGAIGTRMYCGKAMDVARALDFAREHGFHDQVDLVLGTECYKAVDRIKEFGRPVILAADLIHREIDLETGERKETFVPRVYADAGVPFALLSRRAASFGERFLWFQAARCVRNGVSREKALESITRTPAAILDLEDRLGSLAKGRDANLLFLSGDPLDPMTWVLRVMIEGRVVYERDQDIRLKELLEGMSRDELMAAQASEAEKAKEDEKAGSGAATEEGGKEGGKESKPSEKPSGGDKQGKN